ncbi:hypothetical protein [Kribbella sp. NBC_00889]|uniref:hypothetical protein n=1 Tax=Kribbella sp. NBC_00889 TaxID=2975974 RepID=UPI00386E7829|nr:hypothetical protein OG817_22125 [Kribbella sp. NBC_00889]
MPVPTLQEVTNYLGETSATVEQITDALAAEQADQANRCRVPADADPWPASLSQALKRRVARNLALRGLPIAVLQGDSESGSLVLPGSDPEVRRFEGPHRKRAFG